MNTIHPSEKEIQLYVLDPAACAPGLPEHMNDCLHCQQEAESYRILFTEIKKQPAPAFDFDLQLMIIPQLPESRSRFSTENFIAGFLMLFTCGCVGIPVYLFRRNILNMFIGIPSFFIYAILASTTLILLLKILFIYKKFQHQLRLLNFN